MKRLGAALLLLGALGCANGPPPKLGESPPTVPDAEQERRYQATLARFTARAEVYDGFDTRLFTAATFQTPTFREARVRRMGAFQSQPPELVEEKLRQELAEATHVNEFMLGVHVNISRFDDFDKRDSIWRVVLLTPVGEVTPLKIQRIGRADLNQRAIYPYLGEFWVSYRVLFPATLENGAPVVPPDAASVTLKLASTLGRAELTVPVR